MNSLFVLARHRVVEADPRRAAAAAGAVSVADADRRTAAAAAARPRLAGHLLQRRDALAVGLHRRRARPEADRPAAAGRAQLRPHPRAARRGGGEEADRDRHPRRRHRAVRARVRRQQPARRSRSSACATASGWPARPARRWPSAAARAGRRPTRLPRPASPPRSRPTSSAGRSSGSRTTRATRARTRRGRWRCSSPPASTTSCSSPTAPTWRAPCARSARPPGPACDRAGADGTGPRLDTPALEWMPSRTAFASAPDPARGRRQARRRLAPRAAPARDTDGLARHLSPSTTAATTRAAVVHDRHDGPLRVLKSLHPEGPASATACWSIRPAASSAATRLEVDVSLDAGAHALVTTPGATRFYRSAGEPRDAVDDVAPRAGSRLEWLPLETIAYSGCEAENRMRCRARAGRRDDRLGRHRARPAGVGAALRRRPLHAVDRAAGPLARARARSRADDARLLDSPLGWAGRRVLATLWFAAGDALVESRREASARRAREVARGACAARQRRRDRAAATASSSSARSPIGSSRRWTCCARSGAPGGRSPGA